MPKSTKPKRAYKQHPIVKPLKVRNDWVMEGEVYAALLAIAHDQVQEEHLTHLGSHADLVRRLETAPLHAQRQAQTIVRILDEIMRRAATHPCRAITVTALEESALRAAVQVTMPAARAANNYAIARAAAAALKAFDRDGGLRVEI